VLAAAALLAKVEHALVAGMKVDVLANVADTDDVLKVVAHLVDPAEVMVSIPAEAEVSVVAAPAVDLVAVAVLVEAVVAPAVDPVVVVAPADPVGVRVGVPAEVGVPAVDHVVAKAAVVHLVEDGKSLTINPGENARVYFILRGALHRPVLHDRHHSSSYFHWCARGSERVATV
jgi:hypothetical protein